MDNGIIVYLAEDNKDAYNFMVVSIVDGRVELKLRLMNGTYRRLIRIE